MKPGFHIAPAGTPLGGYGWDELPVVSADGYGISTTAAAREDERAARNRATAQAAAAAGQSVADMEAALKAMGEAARNATHTYPKYRCHHRV